MIITQGDKKWRFPDSQIKCWCSNGMVEYQNIHSEFLCKRPRTGDRFIPDNPNNFTENKGVFFNNNINLPSLEQPPIEIKKQEPIIKNIEIIKDDDYKEDIILAIYCAYNERIWLPLQYEWCKLNNVEMYIIDNMSNDGTWEWLQENNIKSHRLDTNDSFNLDKLQKQMLNVIHERKPKWIIYGDCDTFFQLEKTMDMTLNELDEKNYNSLGTTTINLYNTGEEITKEHPVLVYKYGKGLSRIQTRVCRYSEDLRFNSDFLDRKEMKTTNTGFFVNYGATRGKERLQENLKRRQKAWAEGLSKTKGTHYLDMAKQNYIWDKRCLSEIDTKDIKELLTYIS